MMLKAAALYSLKNIIKKQVEQHGGGGSHSKCSDFFLFTHGFVYLTSFTVWILRIFAALCTLSQFLFIRKSL